MVFRSFALAAILMMLCGTARSQTYNSKDYARKPVFIRMMDDTLANFFEVEKAFDAYFSTHEMPEGEDEVIGEHREREKRFSKRQLRRINTENDIRFAVKKYHWWHRRTLPYVQADGRILTPSERLAVHAAQTR